MSKMTRTEEEKTVVPEAQEEQEHDYKKDLGRYNKVRYNKVYNLVREIDNLSIDHKDLTISHDLYGCGIPVVVETYIDYELRPCGLAFNFVCNFSYSQQLYDQKIHTNVERDKFFEDVNDKLYEFLSQRFDFLYINCSFLNECFYDKDTNQVMKFWAPVIIS
jgi:hypothetical protein